MAVTRGPNNIKMTAAGDVSTENVFVGSLIWSGAIVATDQLTIQNGDLVEMFDMVVPAAGAGIQQITYPFGNKATKGLKVSAMTHGAVEFILE